MITPSQPSPRPGSVASLASSHEASARAAMRICTSAEMRNIDLLADREFGLDAAILMENAGRAASQILFEKLPRAGLDSEILIFAGKGNNAGDAFVVARH